MSEYLAAITELPRPTRLHRPIPGASPVAVGTLSGRDPWSGDILHLEHGDGRITTIHREPGPSEVVAAWGWCWRAVDQCGAC